MAAKRQEPGSTVEVAPQDYSASTAEQEPPVLRRWKTSWGFSVFGALVFGVLSVIAGNAITDMVALCWINAIWLALIAVYAACIYPSFFSEGSMLGDSPKVISFFNFFFGGVIFGSLWNASLTNKKKGVSRVVCIVLALLLSGYFGTMGVTAANATPYDSINEPGWTYSDKTGWSSDLVYSSAGGEDAQYWDVFNNNACWVLCEFAEIDYDAAHEYWCEVADVESWDVKLTRGEAEDLARVPIWGQYKAIPETRWATSKCKFETPHARVYAADFWVGNQGYTMRMAHCFFHESDEQPLLNHGGEYAPWIITIGEIEE